MENEKRKEIYKEILPILKENVKGRLILSPRFGKTPLIIELIKSIKPKSILWVTQSKDLAENQLSKEFITFRAKKYLSSLTTSTWRSLHKVTGHYDIIILDEEQHITIKNATTILKDQLTYSKLITMTGTKSKDRSKEWIFNILGLKVLYTLDINEAVDFDILANYSITVLTLDMKEEKSILIKTKNGGFLTSEKSNYIYLDNTVSKAMFFKDKLLKFKILRRMRAIFNSETKLEAAKDLKSILKGRKIFFCSSTDQANKICDNVYHSKSGEEDYNRFLNGEIDEIAMVNKGGTGVTYVNVDHLILVQSDSDVNGQSSQKIARVLLKQKDYEAKIWILQLQNTQDVLWVNKTLSNFNRDKIFIKSFNKFKYGDK